MPRFLTYMVLLGLVALIAATVVFLRSSLPSASSGSPAADGSSPKPFGNTAISHGGPVPTRSEMEAPASVPGHIGLGQQVVISAVVPLLAAIPDGKMSGSVAAPVLTVPAGTVGTVVAIAPAVPPDTRQTETYYKVQLPDGQTGWVPERALRLANAPAREPSPR